MKIIKSALLAAGAVASLGIVAAPAAAQQNTTGMPTVPIEVWALRDVVNAVQVSPDGKHVLVHVVESKEGEYLLKIYKTEDMSKPFRVLNADPMEIISASWVSDRYIFGSAWQQNRSKVNGPEQGTYDYAGYAYDLKTNKFQKIDGNFGIANRLPNDPDHILVETGTAIPDPSGVDPFEAFRPRSYYKVNLARGTRSLVLKGSEKYPTAQFDNEGNPRWTVGYDSGTKEAITYYRKPGEGSWTELMRYDQDKHENLYRTLSGFMGLAGFDPDNPSIGYVIDNRGEDKAALWEFNFDTGQFGEKLAGTDQADIMGIRTSSMPGDETLVGAIYPWDKYRTIWFDEGEKALYEALEAQIPNAHQVSITSRSTDGGTMIVSNRGPRDPGSYWLVRNGTMTKLGSRNPLVQPEQLADVEFIRYPSRDGKLTIPAYFMRPKGEGPYPLIVRHNGGPHVNGVVGYDEWDQMLVNAGYAVLRPQNRISTGWGQKHFDAGYGEHGLAMQDDKDDGALYLIEKGLVDPDRVAFMGWSYGGYSALVAASRSPNIYQCVIAGAAVSDPEKSYKQRRSPYSPKAIDDWAQRRGMIGINPIKEVSNVNVPILMVHGDVDARVLYFHYEDYKDAIEKAGIQDAQFLTLKGADHFYTTLMFEHQQQFYTKMFDFLKNDCGPGGL
ncbi:alpha/beta hydrolase family protein [Qipengyuania nanhaisediminis]|uniref:Dipeptidyl aminopeptidase/acylaminoacyl peptidase n=1 Tax=Qipengyuania nanhaisediminis TaxID=604088 RepID=A0A1I5NK22_9SPHN|nr:prolyl oligopeptidase family serine peptidase [Qipengyuania nanhaisediminis]SFP22153.1 Dipeptidyl aminopeptidase/acylaminoacyl peptidase [Qipengyuania nanhaisediminis]